MTQQRMFRTIWNLLLFCLSIAVLLLIVPKVLLQFREISPTLPDTFRARVIMAGFQGIGLIVAALLLCGSLSSWAWQEISSAGRWFYGVMSLLLVGGVGVSIYIDYADMGFAGYGDYVTFIVSVLLIAFPIVAFGTGYIGLARRFWRGRKLREAV